MTTLIDVAKAAGVSRATVSLVCRRSPLVAEKTRLKVEQAMAEVRYIYNRSAANLRSSLTNTIGLIIPDISNPIYAELLAGVEEVLTPMGKAVFIADTGESLTRQASFLLRMLEMRVDGLIISAVAETPANALDAYARTAVPVVQVLRSIKGASFDYAGIDNRQGARRVTARLLQLGHRAVAFIGSAISPSVNADRYLGFCDAFEERGLSSRAMVTTTCRHSYSAAALSAKSLISSYPALTALVCFNDIVAFGATLGLYELGLIPGESVSVTGFDDVEGAENWRPPLTTMSIEARLLGEQAGTLLAERIRNPGLPVRTIVSEAVLKERGSTAPPIRR